jgi:hypothetical protein
MALIVAALALAMTAAASAGTVVLTFEGIAPSTPYGSAYAPIGTYYSGLGVSFSSNADALCLNTPSVTCSNTSRGGQGDPNSQSGGLIFLTGSQTYMNYSSGFTTGFSMFYTAFRYGGSFNVYDGVDGTGNILASGLLPTTPSTCDGDIYDAQFCPFVAVGVSFSGTAQSIGFGGGADQIIFDDVTFGSATPGNVPEPSSMILLGTGLLGLAGGVRRKIGF